MSENIVIVAAGRTAVGNFGGTLSPLSAIDLGAAVVKGLLERSGLAPEQIDEVIMGQVLAAASGQNPARQTSLKAGLPDKVPAMTINKVCGSGLKAVHLAMQAVACGDAEIVIAGGQESMSQSPHALPRSRDGQRMGDWKLVDTMIVDGLWDAFNQCHMGVTAENIAKKYGFDRAGQDAFAADSQQKAEAAQKAGLARSTLSKIENGQMSPTYEALKKLAEGLSITVPQLFTPPSKAQISGRMAVTKAAEGQAHATATYEHRLLAGTLRAKQMLPYTARIRARSIEEFDGWVRHDGEEFLYVLTGVARLYTEFYEPVDLRRGDSAYYDATMGHNVISLSAEDATILWVTSLM